MRQRPGMINRIGEFADRALERQYFVGYMDASRMSMAIAMLAFSGIYASFGILDILFAGTARVVWINITLRVIPIVASMLATHALLRGGSVQRVLWMSMVVQITFIGSYQVLLLLRMNHAFLEQSMSFMLILIGICLIPSRWIVSMLVSASVMVMFLGLTPLYTPGITIEAMLGVGLCLACVIVFSGIFTYSLNVHRRMQYLRERQLELLSCTDGLTRIYNRQKLDEVLQMHLPLLEAEPMDFSIIMFDMDDFKRINDTYGHMAGDAALVQAVEAVRTHIRGTDVFARWGGEEFIILCMGTSAEVAWRLAQRLRMAVASVEHPQGLHMTASFGVAAYRQGDTAQSLIGRADALLYEAKDAGKNCVRGEAGIPQEGAGGQPEIPSSEISSIHQRGAI